jgi:hypothetical protein
VPSALKPSRERCATAERRRSRCGVVLKGTWYFGYGARFDKAQLKTLPAGSVYTEPSNRPHFAMTVDEPVIVLITGTGPTDTPYETDCTAALPPDDHPGARAPALEPPAQISPPDPAVEFFR